MTALGDSAGNVISGGAQHGPVVQAQNIHGLHIGNVIHAPARPAPVALDQLPPLDPGFTGRDGELAQITALLTPSGAGGAVVVSAVAGLAGVGKTALAIRAGHAARRAGWFPGGILFIDLHGYDPAPVQPGQALDALLRALGVAGEHVPPGVEERTGLYRSALAGISGPVLVIADNASSEAQVRPVLPGPGPHRVIVTSRHTLAGLGARLLDVTVLGTGAAVRVLDQALRDARPADDRITGDPAAAERLAAACGGLPLALRITAALLAADQSLTVGDLASELGDEKHRLEALRYDDGSGTSAPSVAAAFELSCRQLGDDTARLFRLLPHSPGTDLSTAAAAALAGLPGPDTRKLLSQLAKAHLVEATGVAGRWQMHDLLRLYAGQLPQPGGQTTEREQALGRLLDYYAARTEAADAHLRALPGMPVPAGFTSRQDALAWLDAERPSLIAAVTTAATTGRDQIALTLPLNMSEYLSWRRRFDDWISVLTISREAARSLSDQAREAAVLNNLGIALRKVRRFEEAITALQDAAAIFREARGRHSEGTALDNLGIALQQVRRFGQAIIVHQDAAEIYRETGDRHREGRALNNLGIALREVGRLEDAITAHWNAVATHRETGDRHGEGIALNNLGSALQEVRRFEDAVTAHQAAAEIYRETEDRHGEGTALNNLGLALRQVGRFEDAITSHQAAAEIYRETGDRHGEGMTLGNLGLALQGLGRFEEAIIALQDAIAIFRETGDYEREKVALENLEVSRSHS
ncbi:MAG TPA: tetratricopeptide repeat protein [Streptosporangiaceae bacterium]|jgi:tetratricopeptide (TPR) repeat protein